MTIRIIQGDCIAVMAGLPECSVDAIVTDPPYGIRFMGKAWDGADIERRFDEANSDPARKRRTGIAAAGKYDLSPAAMLAFQRFSADWAREAFRVLKPGGHLLSFASTRTYHRMACGVEEAGFEIRDQIGWLFGSGFPKSLDVSKAIDKMDAAEEQERRRLRFTSWVRSQGVTPRQIDAATGTNMGGHYATAASQPAIMTREHLEACRHLFHDVPQWVEQEADIRSVESRNTAAREVLCQDTKARSTSSKSALPTVGGETVYETWNVTAPATEDARQWQGWGTALKPAWEPIVLARKPLVSTVAENVLAHGTGGLNIAGCRVPIDAPRPAREGHRVLPNNTYGAGLGGSRAIDDTTDGRWPANIMHDGSDEVLAAFPDAPGQKADVNGNEQSEKTAGIFGPVKRVGEASADSENAGAVGFKMKPGMRRGDTGSAARFFWSPKTSSAERHEGLEHPGHQFAMARMPHDAEQVNAGKRGNHHPTVKPVDLMRYLCRLITPPGGTVLDPFMGSGSTLKAAELEGFSAIGIELDPEYVEIARRRIAADAPLFADVKVER